MMSYSNTNIKSSSFSIIVSIITPCYNSKSTIQETIQSVLAQTYPHWEMLIIDDCSTDGSDVIIQQYCKQDARIKYFKTEKPSGSPALPRNIGLDHARGDYICFLDSDDCWFPEKLEEQMKFITQHGYDFVYSNYEKMSFEGERNNRIIRTKHFSNYRDNLKTCEIPCLMALLKREIIGGTRFITNESKEDYIFWLAILKKGITAYNTNLVHGLYRESYKSRSSNKINMAKAQWHILRHIEKINLISSACFLTTYLWYGVKKFIK